MRIKYKESSFAQAERKYPSVLAILTMGTTGQPVSTWYLNISKLF